MPYPPAANLHDPTPSDAAPFCADDSPLVETLTLLRAAAATASPVCLLGESGTGKEVMAQYLHRHSPRRSAPFVAVNCGALPATLLEAELFGVVKGAYTGAMQDRPGCIRRAEGGTLFLDEIGDMPLEAQTRLLRVLQERKVMPVGSHHEVPVDFRCVCATHRDLAGKVASGTFREDLYYRLHVLPVHLPPLRERRGDVPGLLRRFLGEVLPPAEVEQALASAPASLWSYPFPGNVRELRNLAERYALNVRLGRGWGGCLPAPVYPQGAQPKPPPRRDGPRPPTQTPSSRLSDETVRQTLQQVGGHRDQAARRLGISRRALQYRLARWQRESGLLYI